MSGDVQTAVAPHRELASMTRPEHAWAPVYRVLLKSSWRGDGVPTCVVAGPNRHRTWLYVHAATPTVLRLHPPVVRFLLDALAELTRPETGTAYWWLPKDTTVSYPECVVIRYGDRAWLHVFAATPSALQLVPDVVEFLRDALTELPALRNTLLGMNGKRCSVHEVDAVTTRAATPGQP